MFLQVLGFFFSKYPRQGLGGVFGCLGLPSPLGSARQESAWYLGLGGARRLAVWAARDREMSEGLQDLSVVLGARL